MNTKFSTQFNIREHRRCCKIDCRSTCTQAWLKAREEAIMTKVIQLTPKYIQKAKDLLSGLTEEQVKDVTMFIAGQFIEEIEQGLEGEIDYPEAPFFEVVDRMYEEAQVKGCYFCDRSIDGNAEPFDYPGKTKICLSCMAKVANLIVAFGIDHRVLFPGMGERKIQEVIFGKLKDELPEDGEVKH